MLGFWVATSTEKRGERGGGKEELSKMESGRERGIEEMVREGGERERSGRWRGVGELTRYGRVGDGE